MMYCELCEYWSLSCSIPRNVIGSAEFETGKVETFDVKVRICDDCVKGFEDEDSEDD